MKREIGVGGVEARAREAASLLPAGGNREYMGREVWEGVYHGGSKDLLASGQLVACG